MSNDCIRKGDTVRVDFNGAQHTLAHRAEVLYMPCEVGDCWVLKNFDTGEIHYVSEPCTITLAARSK